MSERVAEETGGPLVDSFGRVHDNLRISVTDRCNIRCFYCMPAGNVTFMPRAELLSFEEIERFVRLVVPLGVRKIRLTGGEPLVRRDLPRLVERLVAIDGIRDVGLTTNGVLLAEQAHDLFAAGLRRINISLDTLRRDVFARITRRDEFDRVVAGIEAARQVGFDPIKINAVSIRGVTDEEIVDFGHFARRTGLHVRFIEFMPLDADNAWERAKVFFAAEIIQRLSEAIMPLVPVHRSDPSAPATEYVFEDGVGRIGLIASVSQPFCASCNRFRLTADGKLRNCLFSLEETDIRALLRGGATDDEIRAAVRACIAAKREGHEINTARFIQPERPMYSIGG
ncbi:MAG: GTP 3',8-cyclase MoaA [Planctomycetota bacterium]|nr:MAG: GTP 3',8-cyclase MoaA [Planctomycetota bacterium]